jgi:hypothetical protein
MKSRRLKLLQNMICGVAIAIGVCACIDICEDTRLAAAEAPNYTALAVLFERNCGATTPFLRIVTITNSEKNLDFDDRDRWVMISEGQSRFDLSWNDNLELKISALDVAEITMKKTTLEHLHISFEHSSGD